MTSPPVLPCFDAFVRCIRALLHPAEDSPCVLRGAFHCILLAAVHSSPEWRISGDFLECAAQVNKAGQRPLQLLNGETCWDLVEEQLGLIVVDRRWPRDATHSLYPYGTLGSGVLPKHIRFD